MLNRFNCLNDPVNLIDPSGLFLDDAFSPRPDTYILMWQKEHRTSEPYPRLKKALQKTQLFLADSLLLLIMGFEPAIGTILDPETMDKLNPFSPSPANACEISH